MPQTLSDRNGDGLHIELLDGTGVRNNHLLESCGRVGTIEIVGGGTGFTGYNFLIKTVPYNPSL